MNRRQYLNNQDQGFRRQRNFERSKFYSNNNNFPRRFNNQNNNNNNSNNNGRDNYIRRNNNNNMRGINNGGQLRRRQQQNFQNIQSQNINRPFLSLGLRRRRNNNNQNNLNQGGNNQRRPRFGNNNVNGNQNRNRNNRRNRNLNEAAPLKRQANRQARRFDNEKQKRRNEGLIYVSNLSEETVNTDLKEVFESYGRLKRCAVFFDLKTNQSKCRGVVQFTNNVNAQKAKNDLNGKTI